MMNIFIKKIDIKLLNLILCTLFSIFTLNCYFTIELSASEIKPDKTQNSKLLLNEDEKQWIENHPVIRARVGAAPPLHFFEGSPKGISVDYLNTIASRVGFKVEYVGGISWPDGLKYIQDHEKIDLILTAKRTDEREKVISFTNDYLLMPWVIFTRNDIGFISGIDDLIGKTISVERGYLMHKKLASEFPGINILEVETSREAIESVATGKAYAHIGNLTITSYLIQKYNLNNIKIAAPTPFDNHNQAMAVRNDWPQLVSIINKTLKSLSSEDHERIRSQWFSIRYDHGIKKQDVVKWVFVTILFSISIFIVIMFWNKRLQNEIKQHKKSKALLTENEYRYRQIFETNPAIKLIIDPKDGAIVEVNNAACDFYGYSKDEFASLKISDINILSREEVAEEMERAKSENKLFFNFSHKLASGEIRNVEVYSGPVMYGDKTYLHSIIHDVTRRQQAESQLKESRKYYQALFDKNRDGYVINKGSGELLDPNPAFAKMLGYSIEETKQLSFWELTPKKWIEWESHVQGKKLIERGYTDLYEKEYIHRDGTVFPIEVQAFLLNEAKDLESALIGAFVRDITDRKNADETKNRILESSIGGIYIYDLSLGRNIYVNNQYTILTGYTLDEISSMTGDEFFSLFHPKDHSRVQEHMRSVIEELPDGRNLHFDYRFKNTKGEWKWFRSCDAVYERDEGGKVRQLIGTFIDITETKKLEESLQQAQKMESIGSLAGGIAHDFNNLLFPIIGMAEMLLEDLPKNSLEYENASEIFHAGKRAGDLVQQILAFSRQSEHRQTPVRIQNILKEVLKLSRSTIPSNIEIHENIQQIKGLVLADPTQIHQVAMNLITNAYHAVEKRNGAIDIELIEINFSEDEIPDSDLQAGQYVRLSVSDNGIGIPQNNLNKIFEPYFTTKEKGRGTGLGLAVVYGIVKEHGGEIKVYSEIEKGTTFNVYLPLMEKTNGAVSIEQASELENGSESILLVDDEVSVAKLEGQMLSRLGYQVTIKTSSEEALNTFQADPDAFDLVISDMTMPKMTGDQLSKEILSIKPDKPIIICTGFSERINKEQAKVLGVKGFLMKPVVKSDLARIVRDVLDESNNV